MLFASHYLCKQTLGDLSSLVRWRKMRRASHEEFNMRACEKYQFFQLKEAALNVLDIIADPDSWVDCLKRYV